MRFAWWLIPIALLGGVAVGFAGKPAPPKDGCSQCDPLRATTRRPFTEPLVDSVGSAYDRHNLAVLARTDSLYRAGRFGSPKSDEAKKRARTHFQLRTWNGFRYTAAFGTPRTEVVFADNETPFRPFAQVYANTAVYPLRFIRDAQVGLGGFCVSYAMPAKYDEVILDGGVRVRIYRDDIRGDDDQRVPVLSREVPTSEHKSVEMLFSETFCGRVKTSRVVDRGDTLEMVALTDLSGIHIRKFGLHQLGGLAEWRSVTHGDSDPAKPRLGAAAYFPSIHLEMPLFLPDLGLDDLRNFDYPFPLMSAAWFRNPPANVPAWLRVESTGTVKDWESAGPRPSVLSEMFPDL